MGVPHASSAMPVPPTGCRCLLLPHCCPPPTPPTLPPHTHPHTRTHLQVRQRDQRAAGAVGAQQEKGNKLADVGQRPHVAVAGGDERVSAGGHYHRLAVCLEGRDLHLPAPPLLCKPPHQLQQGAALVGPHRVPGAVVLEVARPAPLPEGGLQLARKVCVAARGGAGQQLGDILRPAVGHKLQVGSGGGDGAVAAESIRKEPVCIHHWACAALLHAPLRQARSPRSCSWQKVWAGR